jgi:electron transport complex protein RnfD
MVNRPSRTIMLLVSACMAPGILTSAALLGVGVLVNVAVATLTALAAEAACLRLRGGVTRERLLDGSSLVTALILAIALPPGVAPGVLAVAVITAIGLGKHAYGGLGSNVFNPAMVGYAVVLLSFPLALSSWPSAVDALSGATPLTVFKYRGGVTVSEIWQPGNGFGALGGADSEWINAAFLAGGCVLLALKLAAWRVAAGTLLGLGIPALAAYDNGSSASLGSPLYHWFTGATMLSVFFVTTDPVTHPSSNAGQWLFGLLVGALTFLIRAFGSHPDGIAFAVLLGNAAAPYLDRRLATRRIAAE